MFKTTPGEIYDLAQKSADLTANRYVRSVDAMRGLRLTDLGLAERFIRQHGDRLRYCHPWSEWLLWTGTRWQADRDGHVGRLALKTVLSLYTEAELQVDPETKSEIIDYAVRAESARRINALLDVARYLATPVLPEQLDADPYLLATPAGVVDLRTGEISTPSPDLLITKQTTCAPDPEQYPVLWLETLYKVFDGKLEILNFVQRLLGYAITGLTRERVLLICYGTGSNGKSLMLNTLIDVLGDYARRVPSELFLQNRGDKHPTMIAELHGLRLAVAAETPVGAKLDESLVKELTGSDRLTARRMREDYFTFVPTHKLVLATNHRPRVRGSDHAVWSRLILLPFTVRFWDRDKGETGPPELEADKDLANKLREEWPGILQWLIEGAKDYLANGLQIPRSVLDATAAYRTEEDVVGQWLAERCIVDPRSHTPVADLWADFERWCETNGEAVMSKQMFTRLLTDRGFATQKTSGGARVKLGLCLRELSGVKVADEWRKSGDSGVFTDDYSTAE